MFNIKKLKEEDMSKEKHANTGEKKEDNEINIERTSKNASKEPQKQNEKINAQADNPAENPIEGDSNLNAELSGQSDSQASTDKTAEEKPAEGKKKESAELLNLKAENETLRQEAADLKDRLIRKAAEFDNYKRRTENDQLNLLKYAAESFIVKTLPIYDDLQRSLSHADSPSKYDALREGLQMVLNKFSKVLEEQGVRKIESLGQPFDFNYHEALMQRNVPGVDPHTVVDEIEAGYIYKDKVIRHAKVIVSDENSAK